MQRQTISKALLATVAGSLFALGASPAFAQDTADLTVKGSIVPAACSANFTGGDTVDFGTIKVVDLLPNSYNLLGSKDTELNVMCSADKQVTFTVTDSQAASAIKDNAMVSAVETQDGRFVFGLGTSAIGNTDVALGSYSITSVLQPQVDGNASVMIYQNPGTSHWGPSKRIGAFGDSYSAGTSGTQIARGTQFNFPMTIKAALNKGSALQVAQDTPLNGQAVFTINYQ